MFKKHSIFILAMVFLFLATALEAKGPRDENFQRTTNQPTFLQTLSNIHNLEYWVRADGLIGRNPITGGGGGFYPRGTGEVVFAEGLMWAGYVRDGSTQELRAGGATYSIGTVPGWIVTPGDGVNPPVPIDRNNDRARIYRVRKDFASLDVSDAGLRRDAAEHLGVDVSVITDADAQAILDQYEIDWNEWPADLGAPWDDLNGNGSYDIGEAGIAGADQVIFFIANDVDEAATTGLYGSQPIGIELQVTIWGYNQPGSTLGQMLFKRFRFINKSGFDVEEFYASQWVDPDVGNFTDDLAGNDRDRSVGFSYSGFLTDDMYSDFGLPPAAVGFDFFQGPVVAGEATDTAIVNFERRAGFKNLPMTSFIFFAAGSPISDPPLRDYDGTLEWYNMMQGFTPTTDLENPTPYIAGAGPNAGQATIFPLDGDPFRQIGDIDAFGNNFPPGDRRIALNSGPFTLANGDTNEVVVAVIGGIVAQSGGNNVNAVEQMKLNSDFAQFLYDRFFQGIPKPPVAPVVAATPLSNKILLNWGSDQEAVAVTEADDPVLGFNFEGYNVYQMPTALSTKSQSTKVVTYDKNNFITTIRARQFVPEFGDILEVPVQQGLDTGIRRYFVADQNYINGTPLNNGTTYYFAVTAYNYNSDPTVPEPTLESALDPIAIVPQETKPGVVFEGAAGQTLDVAHQGPSDGVVQVTVIDPAALTGDDYSVTFSQNADSTALLWSVNNLTKGTTSVLPQSQAATLEESDTQPIFDGMQVKVTGPALEWKSLETVANGAGVLDPPDGAAADFQGFPSLRPSDRQQVGEGHWMIHTGDNGSRGSYAAFLDRTSRSGDKWAQIIPNDFEIRFTAGGSIAIDWFQYGATQTVPFELWNIGSGTPGDASDDHRMIPVVIDFDLDGEFDYIDGADHSGSSATNDPYTDWVYFYDPIDTSPGDAGYQAEAAILMSDPASWERSYAREVIARIVFMNWNGGETMTNGPYNQDLPEEGTIFRMTSTKPNTVGDVFSFTAPKVTESMAVAKAEVEKIVVFPNPYYAFHENEANRFERYVTISHLPATAEIRIFNLAGEQVRLINKSSDSQFERWDLRNEAGLPVASGIYICHIDMPEIEETKVLKLFVIQRAEILEFF